MLDGEQFWPLRKRKSYGTVESVAKPVKEYSGSVRGHGGGFVRHSGFDSSGTMASLLFQSSI